MSTELRLHAGCLAVAALLAATDAPAQSPAAGYPSKQIRLIVPFVAGGPNDILARAVGQRLTERWGQPVVIDNRPGAGGRTRAVNRAPACGM